ncbi:hypothetical protein FSP39_001354 [Pinctada imbricata]|uniref:G-protein coupled receptors family 2 profile 2 domain-containing protein n=1 Tax=Pinctada imbricata TaxID=66713 RepID=A0AA89BV92_PINIB|nr:hypothetical protein FSP39_001354 [Pinctada imbricata]
MAMNPSLEDVIKTKDALGIISTVGNSINITNLFNQYVSTFAYADLCPSRQYSVNSRFLNNCTCNPFLVFEKSTFKTRTPCLDARLDYPTFCRRELELSGIPDTRIMKTNYLVTKGCFQARSKRVYADGCLRHDINDVFSVLPLSRNVTWNNSDILVTFDNFYCALCNIHSTEYAMEMNLELDISLQLQRGLYSPTIEEDLNDLRINTSVPWSLEIVCPAILPTSYNVLLGDLLKIAHAQKCRIRYVTDVQKSPLCKDISNQVDHCDKISNWTFPDDDVKWACLNQSSLDLYYARKISSPNPEVFDPDDYTNYRTGIYRNRFCSICKPQHDFGNFSFFLGSCNVTGLLAFSRMPLTDDIFGHYEKGCQMAVRTYYYYPYKNIFCAFCDGTTYTSSATQGVDSKIVKYQRVPGLNWFPIMRNIFSIADPYGVDYVITKKKCEINQVYDAFENKCRNISCFPGKVSKNASCVPLFSTTKMLRYTLALGGHFQFPNRTTEDAMMFLILELDQFIRNSLGIRGLHTEHVYAYLNQPCDEKYSSKSIASVRMYLVVFISETVSRQVTEEILLNITAAKVSSANLTARFRPMKEASRLPLLLHTKRRKNECFVYMNPSTAFTMKPYRPVPVSELLLCPYVVLSAGEYIYHTETHSLKLKRSGKILHESNYELQGNNDIIICKKELERTGYFLESTQDFSDLKSLWIISVICSVVSSICLLIAIVTYCIFPSLRTVPGIINAVSMVTLLFSLCFNYAGYLFVLSDEGCAIFGILLHYSWLCVFTTMLINNYHMNRVFIAVLSVPQSSTRAMFARYFTCAFGVPLLIISIYIVYVYVDGSMSFLGYGGQRCFILNQAALIVAFILPISLIILTNVTLFILTSITMLKTPDVRSNQDHRNNFRIILKMSSITGICWVLRVIDSFLSLSALSYISSILTCSQGIFVFLAFIANSRVWQMYKNKLFSEDSSDSDLNKNSNASKRQITKTTEGM